MNLGLTETEVEQLYARLERPLYNVVYRWVWNPEESQDVVQEAFVRLWRMRSRVDGTSVEPLAYKIAINLAVSRARSRKLWRWVSMNALRDRPAVLLSAERSLVAEQEGGRVRAAGESLPEDLRRVVMLTEYSELSYAEIAAVLSIPAGTVGSRRNRALRHLKSRLIANEGRGHERTAEDAA